MKKIIISVFAISALVALSACGGSSSKAASIDNNSTNTGLGDENQSDKDEKMWFSACERQDDGQTSDGAYAALDVSLAVPEGEGTAQRNVARGIRAICYRSPVAEELGKAPADASINGVADYYASAFKKGLKTGKVYPLCTYSLRISEKFQNKVGVVFSVITGVWGNGGPWEYDTFVRFSDGKVLDSKDLMKIPEAKLRALVKKYDSEEISSYMSVEEGGYQVMPAANGKVCLHVSTGSHFFEDVVVPQEEVAPYLTAEGKAVFDAQSKSTPVQHSQPQQSTTAETAAESFILADGKLGPIQVGARFANIPATYAGLYDKYTRETEKEYNEVEDYEITFVCYQFNKAGKNIFRVIMEGNKISAIQLQEGSASIVKTQDGFYIGYPARTLFNKKPTEWYNLEGGTAACFDGNYTYEVSASDRVSISSIESAKDFKQDAKICTIIYHD